MARSDLIVTLVKAGSRGDHLLFRKAVEAMIVEEQAKQHHLLAQKLTEELRSNSSSNFQRPSCSRRQTDQSSAGRYSASYA